MNYWLVKSEPNTWSWEDHCNAPNATAEWDGVRNHQAKNNLKAMSNGDRVMFYHSVKQREVVGICEVVREHYPDPTDASGKFVMVDLKVVGPMPTHVHLKQIKAEDDLQEMKLVKQSRLSVMPVTSDEWAKVCELGEWVEPTATKKATPTINTLKQLQRFIKDGFLNEVREYLHYSHDFNELMYDKDGAYHQATIAAAIWAAARTVLGPTWYVQCNASYPTHKGRSHRNDKADVMIWSPKGEAIAIEVKAKHGKPVYDAAKKVGYHIGVGSSDVAAGYVIYADYETEDDYSEEQDGTTIRGLSLIWY